MLSPVSSSLSACLRIFCCVRLRPGGGYPLLRSVHFWNEKTKNTFLQFTIRRAFLEDVRALRVRLVLVGLAHVVLLPFLLLFMVVYFFLQNAQEWHSSKVRRMLLLLS